MSDSIVVKELSVIRNGKQHTVKLFTDTSTYYTQGLNKKTGKPWGKHMDIAIFQGENHWNVAKVYWLKKTAKV